MRMRFHLRTLFTAVTTLAVAFAAWRASEIAPESRVPLGAIAGLALLTFLGIGSTRVVCWSATVSGVVSALVFTCIDYFEPFHPKDRLFYIFAYSTLVAAAGAFTGFAATALLAARDAFRRERPPADS